MTELALKLAIERFNKKHEEDGFIRLSGQFELLLDSPYLATDRGKISAVSKSFCCIEKGDVLSNLVERVKLLYLKAF